MSSVTFSIVDHSGEYGHVTLGIPDVDETTWAATDTAVAGIQAAITALTMGNIASRTLTAYRTPVNDVLPTDAAAQRELGLRLWYKDDVNFKKFYITVPAPDVDLVAEQGSNEVDLSGPAVVSALVTALEALMVSPYGNSVTFYRGMIVGRNN
jgi:hypothetical protein